MKKILNLFIIIFFTACSIGAGENSKMIASKKGYFPQLVGIDLEGERREIPQSFNNKINIVVVAFKREQQKNVDGWIKVVDEIISQRSDINFYELPVIYELNSVSRSFINNGMRRGVVGSKARKRTITIYTNREVFFQHMKMKENNIYVLMLDKAGKVIQKIEGDATSENIEKLKNKLR